MEDKRKRQRSANFTKHEENILFNIILKYKHVIENKKTDAVSSDEKKTAWQNITNEFNAISPNCCERTIDSLKKMFDNRKKELRKDKADERKETLLTGGGPPVVKKGDSSSDLLLTIMNEKSVFGTESVFDSDSFFPSFNCRRSNDNNRDKYLAYELNTDENEVVADGEETISCQNDIEFEDENNTDMNDQECDTRWKSYKPLDLNKTKSNVLQLNRMEKPSCSNETPRKKIKIDPSRRRPATVVKALTSSNLSEKYDILIEKKLEIASYKLRRLKQELDTTAKEHELTVEALRLDIEIKIKTLKSMDD